MILRVSGRVATAPAEPDLGGRTRFNWVESCSSSIFLFEHDLFGKPVPTPDHALATIDRLAYRHQMRLKSSIWVAAYLRRCQTEGIFGAVRRRGAEEAGAVFVKVALLDGNAMLYAPAPQTVYDDSRPIERIFAATSPQPVLEASVEERLAKEVRFDPDVWIVETEDRAGRHFLELARA